MAGASECAAGVLDTCISIQCTQREIEIETDRKREGERERESCNGSLNGVCCGAPLMRPPPPPERRNAYWRGRGDDGSQENGGKIQRIEEDRIDRIESK